MSMPSSFELGGKISGNVSRGIQGARDKSAIDEILGKASASEDPQAMQTAFQSILQNVSPDRQPQALQILQSKVQEQTQQRQQQAYQEQGLNPNLPEGLNKEILKTKGQAGVKSNLDSVGKTLDSIEDLIGKEGIGLSGGWNPSSEARFNRGQFQSLQAAVLPLFKSMFPRGMTEKEFKFINENYIPQVSDTNETQKGKIKGLRQLLGQNSGQQGANEATREMRDAQGNVYDIPSDLYEKALSQGLK
jgi:hypothetical protein